MILRNFPYKSRRFWRTVKYLKLKQVYYRILKTIWFRKPNIWDTPKKSPFTVNTAWVEKPQSIVNESTFVFLNSTQTLDIACDWAPRDLPLLWVYNLHYFDGLLSPLTPEITKERCVKAWIVANNKRSGIGWEPYPLSLRIVNWIKWDWQKDINPITGFRQNLANQICHLYANLEFHLLGNHLLENSKALIFGGCYFEGPVSDKWLLKGLDILDRQLEEQILDDGGHFELSPMYHIVIFELLLDILALSKERAAPIALQMRYEKLFQIASRMSSWLLNMVHPDGQIPYFNDSANNLAQSPKEIQRYWQRLGGVLDKKINSMNGWRHLSTSGYLRLQDFDAVLFLDIAEIGPSYLPGHGHADALSVELSLFGKRVFGNLGTSEYGDGDRRLFERSTAAHSTMEISGLSSSEVWGGFRVGRRAKIHNVDITSSEDRYYVCAEHDGYEYLEGKPFHRRSIELSANELVITDKVVGSDLHGIVRFHLHPSVSCVLSAEDRGQFILSDGKVIQWVVFSANCTIVLSKYADEFGLLSNTTTLQLRQFTSKCSLKISW